MKRPVSAESVTSLIEQRIKDFQDWRGKTLAKVRDIIHEANPETLRNGSGEGRPFGPITALSCTGETYKHVVKMRGRAA